MSKRFNGLNIFIICFFLLFGCTSLKNKHNQPWNIDKQSSSSTDDYDENDYIYENIVQINKNDDFIAVGSENVTEKLHLILAVSGEGSKGGAFTYGVLEALHSIKSENNTSLLQEVDVISAVSGAGGPVMSYGLYGEEIFKEEKEEHFFKWSVLKWDASTVDFFLDTLVDKSGPWRAMQLLSENYAISDMVTEFISENFFDGATYYDLIKEIKDKRRPFVILNATDIVKGRRFEFSQPQFDFLCSDLSNLQIGAAVAATIMPPILTTGVRLHNFSVKDHCRPYIKKSLENSKIVTNPYLKQKTGDYSKNNAYAHLVNGGLADNLAIGPIIDGINKWDSAWSLRRMLSRNPPEKILIIVANMKNRLDENIDFDVNGPSLKEQIFPILGMTGSKQSLDSLKLAELELRHVINLLEKSGQIKTNSVKLYDLVIIDSGDLQNESESKCLESFVVQSDQLEKDMGDVALMAKRILLENNQFIEFIQDNGWRLPTKILWDKTLKGQCADLSNYESKQLVLFV